MRLILLDDKWQSVPMVRDFRASIPDETMNQLRILKGKYGVDTNGEILQELVETAQQVEESDEMELGA